jgi:plasmid stabilization system protein ParE
MKLVYSSPAFADLDRILVWYSANASPAIAESIEQRLDDVIDRICRAPETAPRLSRRSQVRVVALVRYPFRIFYRMNKDAVDILLGTRQDGRSQSRNMRWPS